MGKLLTKKENFQKYRNYEPGHIKIELIHQGKLYGQNCTLKYLDFVNSVLYNNNWDIINDK